MTKDELLERVPDIVDLAAYKHKCHMDDLEDACWLADVFSAYLEAIDHTKDCARDACHENGLIALSDLRADVLEGYEWLTREYIPALAQYEDEREMRAEQAEWRKSR